MPVLAFGLGASKPKSSLVKQPVKRKALFDEENEETDFPKLRRDTEGKVRSLTSVGDFDDDSDNKDDEISHEPPRKSPKLSIAGRPNGSSSAKYGNLSSLRSAKIHDEKVSQIDASVYDYDAAYETFHATPETKDGKAASTGPKYMTSLLQTTEVRKRDQLRAREKLLQREREAEGDEFADKEKFVTGAYKNQQEEVKRMEEEEKQREAEEEAKRRKGEGMKGFYGSVLKREEERMKAVEEAAKKKEESRGPGQKESEEQIEKDLDEAKMAMDLNEKGARIVMNDEGEVVDKRQLLSAGLNLAPKKTGLGTTDAASKKAEMGRSTEHYMTSKARDAKEAQRERQSRMVERQIEEMAKQQQQQEAQEEKQQEEKTKSRVTEADKSSARERYLQRKKEREGEAEKVKENKGSG